MYFGSHCSHSIISIFQFRNITDLQVRRSGTMITLNARSNEKKLTIMAMVLILVFVICNSFYTIYFPLKYGKVILYKSRGELPQYTNDTFGQQYQDVRGSSLIWTCWILNFEYLFWFFQLRLSVENDHKYSKFKIWHVQINELPRT